MGSMKEMQGKMYEPRDEVGAVRGVETIRAGSPDLPPLAVWEAQQGPLILGDWLLLAEPIIADLSLTVAEWWKELVRAAEDFFLLLALHGISPVARNTRSLANKA